MGLIAHSYCYFPAILLDYHQEKGEKKKAFPEGNRHFHWRALAASGRSMCASSCALCSSWTMTNLEDASKAVPGSSEASSSPNASICCHWIHSTFLTGFLFPNEYILIVPCKYQTERKEIFIVLRGSWQRPEEEHGSVHEAIMLAGTAVVVPGVPSGPQLLSAPSVWIINQFPPQCWASLSSRLVMPTSSPAHGNLRLRRCWGQQRKQTMQVSFFGNFDDEHTPQTKI